MFGGRNSNIVSSADAKPQIEEDDNKSFKSPLSRLRKMGDKLKPHTAITMDDVLDLPFSEHSGSRRSFSSTRSAKSKKSRRNSITSSITTQGPATQGPRIADTLTTMVSSPEQARRMAEIEARMRTEPEFKQPDLDAIEAAMDAANREQEQKQKTEEVSPPSKDLESKDIAKKFPNNEDQIEEKRKRQAKLAGWRQMGNFDPTKSALEDTQDLVQQTTVLENYVSDKFLGDWYHNTAIILFTALAAWLLGKFRFSFTWVCFILLFSATAYRSSVRRMRRNYRDDVLRETLFELMEEKDTESMEWMNSFLSKFWLIYEPSMAQMITEIGNEVLQEQTPGFIDSMKIDKFTLGTKAPRIDFVRSFPKVDPQTVVIDMAASFTPSDTMDLTARQLQTKINPKVQLGVRLGKGFLTKNFPILLEDMNFKGTFRLKLQLMDRFPHVQTIDFSFLEPPMFDFVLKPIGGDKLGFDINIIPGLSKFIKDMVNANLGPMLYAPNAFQINVEQLMAGVGVMSGIGVLSINIISAKNLKMGIDGRCDPYVAVRAKDKKFLARTQIKSNTDKPVFNEFLNVIVTNGNDNLLLEVFDFEENLPDRSVGQLPLKISELQGNGAKPVMKEITCGGRKAGEVKFIAHYAPVTMPQDEDEGVRDTKSGILNLKINKARNLDGSVSSTGTLSPFIEVELNGRLIDSSKVASRTNFPEFQYTNEHIINDKLATLLTLRVRDNRKGSKPTVGIFKMKLSQLLIEFERGTEWFSLENGKGEVQLDLQWKPCNIRVGGGASNYVEPIGVIRLNIMNAKNLLNLEHLGKIDPYCRVFVGHHLCARTDWFHNDLNPEWNEVLYIPVQSEMQTLTLEVMDVEKHSKDRSLGAFKINLEKVINRDEHDNYKVTLSDKVLTNKLMLPNRGPKGSLQYTLEFFPAIPIISMDERQRVAQDRKVIKMLREKGEQQKNLSKDEKAELAAREDRLDVSGTDMSIEDQLKYNSGVLALAVVSLEGHKPGQSLRITANNHSFPFYSSPVFKSGEAFASDECPDFVSGQMNLSSVRIELGSFGTKQGLAGLADIGEEIVDKNAAEVTISCFELIKNASLQPQKYTLANNSVVELQARYFPLPGMQVSPSEDISDNGTVEIMLKAARGLRSADSNGKSDPYCAFYMNNQSDKVYKSKTVKETLDPVWDEKFRFAVQDYKSSFVKAIVNDWDMGNRDDFLGGYKFDFSDLEPLVWKDYEVALEDIKRSKETNKHKELQGILTLSMRFNPGELQRVGGRFLIGPASVARAAGGLVNMGVGVAGGVAGVGVDAFGVGVGALGSATSKPGHLIGKIRGRRDSVEEAALEEAMSNYQIQVESVETTEAHEIQVRCYLLSEGEKEIWRSSTIKVENGIAVIDQTFETRTLPEGELGVKLLVMKSLGRHSDLGQSSTSLVNGRKTVKLQNDSVVILNIEHTV